MSEKVLQVAFIGGAQYDRLYHLLPAFEQATGYTVQIEVQLPHPALNAHIAANYADAIPKVAYDLISTHIKYAPSQKSFLQPLDNYFSPAELGEFSPAIVQKCRLEGVVYQIPRNVDVRLLFYRTDIIDKPPTTWQELLELGAKHSNAEQYGYVFPGCYSGLFGTFYELAAMEGDQVLGEGLQPLMGAGSEKALAYLHQLYTAKIVPPEVPQWHYDEVATCFCEGKAAMVVDFPAFYGQYLASPIADKFEIALYPVGSTGERHVYSGGHSFAVPSSCHDIEGALALLRHLTSYEAQLLEARGGAVPTRSAVLAQIIAETPENSRERRRWQLLQETMANHMLLFPKSPLYPLVEDSLWRVVQSAVVGKLTPAQAVSEMRAKVEEILR